MSSTPIHRSRDHSYRSSIYLALVSGASAITIALWGLNVLGGN
jgi:hypothetical protein